jgi:hypothetical protein
VPERCTFIKTFKTVKMQFKTKDTGILLRMIFNEWNGKDPFRQIPLLLIMPFLVYLIISFNHFNWRLFLWK